MCLSLHFILIPQQQRLSVSVPGLMLIKKDKEFAATKAFPADDDSINEDDVCLLLCVLITMSSL